METHGIDPTTDESVDPWNAFHDELGGLSERLKTTYRDAASNGGPSEDEIKEALGTLVAAWDQVAESVSHALQDPDVRARLKNVASSLATAVGNTISELGTELRDAEVQPTPDPVNRDEEE